MQPSLTAREAVKVMQEASRVWFITACFTMQLPGTWCNTLPASELRVCVQLNRCRGEIWMI